MKKIFTISVIMAIMLSLSGHGQSSYYPNPSATYAEKMGYLFSIVRDASRNEQGTVTFPDGSKADAWAFLQGKAGRQYSYCAKKGYSTESKSINHGSWTEEISVCTKLDINGRETKIAMLDLMEKNGEPLIPVTDRALPPEASEMNTDPGLNAPNTLPTTFDWRSYNGHSYIGPVRNQGNCGSCYAFGALSSAESVYNFATGNYDANCVDLSESFIIWCMGNIAPYNTHLFGCAGADLTYTQLQALVDSGVTYEANFPYQTTNPGTCAHWDDPRIKFNNWYRVNCQNIDGIKTAIMTYGAVNANIQTTAAFNGYTGGVYIDNNTSCNGAPCYYTTVNHNIALVGWDVDSVAGEYWILRNSWGSGWGESGYMKIAITSAAVSCEVAYITYIPPSPPVATTNPATGISLTGATLKGTVTAKGLLTTVTFEYGLTTAYGSIVNATPSPVNGNYNYPENAILTGLNSGTTYHFRIKAVNSLGTTYGSDLTFTTNQLPSATTNPETNVTSNSVTLNGAVNAHNISTNVNFEYGLTTTYGTTLNGTPTTLTDTTNTSVIANITGLTPGTLYHFRVKAVYSSGTTYGSDLTYTTNLLPNATTNAATNIANTSATLNGTVNANGITTTVTFQYGITTSYGSTINGTPNTVTGTTNTSILANITGLTPGTLYHFRVIAANSSGTIYGNDLTFTTTVPTCQDNYEPNNTLAQGSAIATGVEISALINLSTDVDWFKFNNTTSAKNIKVELYNLPADYDLKLYKSDGTLLKTSAKRGTTSETVLYNTSKVATYYIKIYGYNGSYDATNCYKVKVSISNSTWKSSEVEEPSNDETQPVLIAYPNPTNGKVTLDYSNPKEGKIVLKVFNMTGKQIITEELQAIPGDNIFNLDLSGYSSGVYVVQLTNDSETMYQKIFLQK
jgi:C1A family cysteine protease